MHKNKGLLRGPTSLPNHEYFQREYIATDAGSTFIRMTKRNNNKANKPTQNKQKEQSTFCHPADTKLQQVLVCSLLSYPFGQLPVTDISPSMDEE